MNTDKRETDQQNSEGAQRPLEKNETLHQADTVADYGKNTGPQQSNDEERPGAIPLSKDETIGNP